MKLKPEQLKQHLSSGLAPLYLVGGDEPLLIQEACDAIRAAARREGFSERELFTVEPGFDWGTLHEAGAAMSLFSERKLIELRLPSGKPGDKGGKALVAYADQPAPDNLLLIQAGKIEASSRNTKWYKALDKAGAVIQVWPLEPRQLPGWTMRRMQGCGLQPSQEAVTLLVERVEGNLLACAQEIEKLLLLYGPRVLTVEEVANSVADSARFDIYKLVDGALQGDVARTVRIVEGLQGEGVEPVLVLWALSREIRSMASMAFEMSRGSRIEPVLAKWRVWEKRKPLVRAGLQRHSVRVWQQLLRQAADVDGVIKGVRTGNRWDELLQLSLALGGVRLCSAAQ